MIRDILKARVFLSFRLDSFSNSELFNIYHRFPPDSHPRNAGCVFHGLSFNFPSLGTCFHGVLRKSLGDGGSLRAHSSLASSTIDDPNQPRNTTPRYPGPSAQELKGRGYFDHPPTNPELQRPPRHYESSGTDSTERKDYQISSYFNISSPPCGVVLTLLLMQPRSHYSGSIRGMR